MMKLNKYPVYEYNDLKMPSDDMDTDIRSWHSHLVKVRKYTKCVYCGASIKKGDFALSERGFCDGEPFLIHDCIDCADDLIAFYKHEIDINEYYNRFEKAHKRVSMMKDRLIKENGRKVSKNAKIDRCNTNRKNRWVA